MTTLETLTVEIAADTSRFRKELASARSLADDFGRSLTRAFEGAALRGTKLSDVLRAVAADLSRMALKAALKPLESGLSGLLGSLLGGLDGPSGALSGLKLLPFARGGVLSAPALFPLGPGRIGIAGEAGAEAVLPLARGADGRLGVRAQGHGGPVNVTFNVTTPDAASFARSETQIGAMMSRVLARGERNL